MDKKKVFILLPDGVGLRNFVYTSFYEKLSKEHEVVFWNNTAFQLKKNFGIEELQVSDKGSVHFMTDILKRAKNRIELKLNKKKFNDSVYLSYIFYSKSKNLKSFVKNRLVDFFTLLYKSERGLKKVNKLIEKYERNTILYKESKKQLTEHKPEIVFCTNQRHTSAIAPILAAKDLQIKTVTFIFSWDNLPKGTLVLNPDYYFVWSDYMKDELLKYYPEIHPSQIKVTGTPQFEPHFDQKLALSKEEFFKEYKLDNNRDYICFSGNDFTSCPYDQNYLEDLAKSVTRLNAKGHKLGIIYRKCPTDFTTRYDSVISDYSDIIVSIDPKWDKIDNNWSSIMPLIEDNQLLRNTVEHSILVVNVGSSMVFDAVSHKTPCAYLKYDTSKTDTKKWSVFNALKFVHFRSMPSDKAVIWFESEIDYDQKIEDFIKNGFVLTEAENWFQRINAYPTNAAEKMITFINKIIA